ncbi:MAG: SPOR domain-containing protein [bacterium]
MRRFAARGFLAAAVALALAGAARATELEDAELAWDTGQREDAARIVRNWVAANGDLGASPEALLMLARTAVDPAEATARWEQLLQLEPRGERAAEARFGKGMAAYSAGLYVQASQEFATLATDLEDWFDSGRAQLWVGYSYLGANQPKEALEAFREAQRGADEKDDVIAAEFGEANALFQLGQMREALRRFDKFAKDHGRDGRAPAAAQRSIECLRVLGEESEAKKRAGELADDFPNSGAATITKAEILEQPERATRPEENAGTVEEAPTGPFWVQVASFSDVKNAAELKRRITALGIHEIDLEPAEGPDGPVHRIVLGPYSTQEKARAVADTVATLGELNPRVRSQAAR